MIQTSTDSRSITFTVPGEVRGQGRPRTTIRGGYATIYDSPEDKASKHNIQLYAQDAMAKQGFSMAKPDGMGITVQAKILIRIPRSMSRKTREAALSDRLLPQRKPDLDNVLKQILDAMNAVVYKDDAEVTRSSISRHYGETPKLIVKVSWNERKEDA